MKSYTMVLDIVITTQVIFHSKCVTPRYDLRQHGRSEKVIQTIRVNRLDCGPCDQHVSGPFALHRSHSETDALSFFTKKLQAL